MSTVEELSTRLPRVVTQRTGWVMRNRLWIALAGVYLIAGMVLVFGFDVIMTDAISRVANASYMIRGREPHMAAVGFVWTPLPSLLMLPLLPLQALFPALLTDGLAANVISAIAMSGAVRQAHLILKRSSLSPQIIWALTATFAIQPVVFFYGANGMSESLMMFGLLMAARALIIWLEEGLTVQLVVCGNGIAIAYLSRYEAGLSFLGVALIVAVVSWKRAGSGHVPPMSAMRLTRANTTSAGGALPHWIVMNELLLVGLPAALAFIGWALMSWVVTGSPFAQLTSEYGVREFIKVYRDAEGATGGGLGDIVRTFGLLQPLALAFVIIGIVAMMIRRERALAVVITTLAPALLFDIFTVVTGSTLFLYRYLILIVPITIFAAASICSFLQSRFGSSQDVTLAPASPLRSRQWMFVAAPVLLLVLTFPVAARNLFNEEQAVRSFNPYALDQEIAEYVDSLDAPNGSVLTDSGTGFAVLIRSEHPDRWVITSDGDFRERVADLSTVSYVLVPENTGLLQLDALNRRWPDLFQTGLGPDTLIKEWKAKNGRPAWRLFKTSGSVFG